MVETVKRQISKNILDPGSGISRANATPGNESPPKAGGWESKTDSRNKEKNPYDETRSSNKKCGEGCEGECGWARFKRKEKKSRDISLNTSGTGVGTAIANTAPEIESLQYEQEQDIDTEQENIQRCRIIYVSQTGTAHIEAGCGRNECGECVSRKAGAMSVEGGPWVAWEVRARWVREFMQEAVETMAVEEGRIRGRDGKEYDVVNEEDQIFGTNAIGYPTLRRPRDYERQIDTLTSHKVIAEWFEGSGVTIGPGASTEEERRRARQLLFTWKDLFCNDLRKVPVCELVRHYIPTYPGSRPHKATMPLYTPEEMSWMAENLPKMVDSGILTFSDSPWSNRAKFVKKKKPGELRMVHVNCPLNRATIKSNYPMKRIEPIIQCLMQWKYNMYWAADATVGYWGILLAEEHAYKTAFNTPFGQFCYLRMGMGLSGAPHTYSRMKDILAGPIPAPRPELGITGSTDRWAYEHFQDDDYGASRDFETQFEFLHKSYFPRISWAGLMLNPPKTEFWMLTLKLLGYGGSGKGGLRPSIDKIAAIRDYPRPETPEEVERFVNVTTYLKQWIPGRSEHAKKVKSAIQTRWVGSRKITTIEWKIEHEQSFNHIKRCIMDNVIWGGDLETQYHLATDASNSAIGGVLFQLAGLPGGTIAQPKHRKNERIIMFLSKPFSSPETRYNTTEREALAVVRCLEEVRWLVLGSPFPLKIYTDHRALLTILKGDEARGRLVRWQYQLAEYDLEIHHIPGSQNVIADGMSRMRTRSTGEEKEVAGIEAEERGSEEWREWSEDEWYGSIVRYKLTGAIPVAAEAGEKFTPGTISKWRRRLRQQSSKFVLSDAPGTEDHPRNLPTIRTLLYREKNGDFAECVRKHQVASILHWAHDVHGHFAEAITMKGIIGRYYWPTRHRDVAYYCRSCPSCQRVGPLRPSQELLPILQLQPMDLMGMDFIGPLAPVAEGTGARYVLIVVDYFTRYLFTKSMPSSTSEEVVKFLTHIAESVGWPRAIYNDNGSHFVSSETQNLLRAKGVKQFPAPKSHPSSVGLAERYVQLIVVGFRTLLQSNPSLVRNWDKLLPQITHSINTRIIRSHGYTPSQLLFGFNIRQSDMDATARDKIVTRVLEDGAQTIADKEQVPTSVAGSNQITTEPMSSIEAWTYHDRMAKVEEMREDVRTRMLERSTPTKPGRLWKAPRENDLVLLRRFELDKQHGRKFEPRWEGPYELRDVAWHGRSGRLVDIATKEAVRVRKGGLQERCHLDDLKVFIPREEKWIGFDADLREKGELKFVGMTEVLKREVDEGGWAIGNREFDLTKTMGEPDKEV